MQKVWFRKQTGWWCASIKEAGSYRQIKLVKAPNTRDGRKLAESQLVQELATRQHASNSEPESAGGSVGWVPGARDKVKRLRSGGELSAGPVHTSNSRGS